MSTVPKQAFLEVISRLQAISKASGYNTDLGANILAGVTALSEDDPMPTAIIFSGDEQVERLTYGSYNCNREVIIEIYVSPTDATVSIEEAIEDVQRALETPDETLGGLVSELNYTGVETVDQPQAGKQIAGIRVTYAFEYRREYGT